VRIRRKGGIAPGGGGGVGERCDPKKGGEGKEKTVPSSLEALVHDRGDCQSKIIGGVPDDAAQEERERGGNKKTTLVRGTHISTKKKRGTNNGMGGKRFCSRGGG